MIRNDGNTLQAILVKQFTNLFNILWCNVPGSHQFYTFDPFDLGSLLDQLCFGYLILVTGRKKPVTGVSQIS
jgi:hypothetical protein